MKNKVLTEIYVAQLDEKFNVYLPLNKNIANTIELIYSNKGQSGNQNYQQQNNNQYQQRQNQDYVQQQVMTNVQNQQIYDNLADDDDLPF